LKQDAIGVYFGDVVIFGQADEAHNPSTLAS
ncbi:unnamed protein product, partial [marine sediment metagenome]